MPKKAFTKLFLPAAIVLFCFFSLENNSSYTAFLKVQNSARKYRINREVLSLEEELANIYMKIGRKISTEDITLKQVTEEINHLVDLSKQYLLKIEDKKSQLIMSDERLRKEIAFEDLLKAVFSGETSVRLNALRILCTTDTEESLPYLGVLLIDPNPTVRQEAGAIVNQVISSSSEEIRKRIPNLQYLPGINLKDSQDSL